MYTMNDDRFIMSINGLKAAFHMPAAIVPKYYKKGGGTWNKEDGEDCRGEEVINPLPAADPRFAFPVDEYKLCPSNWMHGSSKASSYWLPVRPGCGMWLDLNYNYNHKDRLTRFNFGVYERYFASHGVKIEWLDQGQSKTYEQELVDDMISLMSSFSSKIYGKRSAENRKRRKLEKLAALGQLPAMAAAAPVEDKEEALT